MKNLKPITSNYSESGGTSSVTEVASILDWNVDVSPSSSIAAVEAVLVSADPKTSDSQSRANSESSVSSSPRRSLSRLAPKKDGKSVQRRQRLQKIRSERKSSPVSADSQTATSELASSGSAGSIRKLARASIVSKGLEEAEQCVESDDDQQAVVQAKVISSGAVAEFEVASPDVEVMSEIHAPKPEVISPQQPIPKRSKQRKTKPGKTKPDSLSFTVTEPQPEEEERYIDWLRRVVLKHKSVSFVTTFYVHWLLILALAALLVNGPEDTVNMLLNASFAAEDFHEESTFDVSVPEPTPIEPSEEDAADVEEESVSTLDESEVELDESVLGDLAPASDSEVTEEQPAKKTEKTESSPRSSAVDRSPPQAVRKGSFSVWTEPSNPQAGEAYRIIIQVCLPDGMQKYNVADLQGVVIGSDGYRKPIPGYLRGFLPIEDGYARLIVPIVTADEKVQDTIFIRSRILKETQKLLLQFESSL